MPDSGIPAKTLTDLGWGQLLEQLAKRCHTNRGADEARALPFLDAVDDARERVARVSEMRRLRDDDEAPPFGGIQDVRTEVARAEKGGDLEPPELIAGSKCRFRAFAYQASAPMKKPRS